MVGKGASRDVEGCRSVSGIDGQWMNVRLVMVALCTNEKQVERRVEWQAFIESGSIHRRKAAGSVHTSRDFCLRLTSQPEAPIHTRKVQKLG